MGTFFKHAEKLFSSDTCHRPEDNGELGGSASNNLQRLYFEILSLFNRVLARDYDAILQLDLTDGHNTDSFIAIYPMVSSLQFVYNSF